jgi:hypothetical protein
MAVRGVDSGLWRLVRIIAVVQDRKIADVLNDAIRDYLRAHNAELNPTLLGRDAAYDSLFTPTT